MTITAARLDTTPPATDAVTVFATIPADAKVFPIDAAVPAAFLGLVWPRLVTKETRIAAVIAALMAILLTPYVSSGVPIIATVFIALVMGWKS